MDQTDRLSSSYPEVDAYTIGMIFIFMKTFTGNELDLGPTFL